MSESNQLSRSQLGAELYAMSDEGKRVSQIEADLANYKETCRLYEEKHAEDVAELSALKAENERLKADFRNGSWMDKWGACKICGGEIPHGHAVNCDLCKLELEIAKLESRIAEMGKLLDRMEHKQLPDKIPYPYTKWSCVDDCPACAWEKMKGEKQGPSNPLLKSWGQPREEAQK